MSRMLLTEARPAGTATATPVEGKPGRFLLQLITPGWGSSGYYSPDVLKSAAEAGVFKAGMHSYLDHEHGDGSGVDQSGNRSVKDLASALAENARWDGEALVAEASVFGPYREVLDQMKDAIGVSIRAYAETSIGEAEGRRGVIIDELVEGISADYVSHAGRGGKILQVIESARPVEESRNIGQWIESRIHRDFTITADDMAGDGRLTREERIGLSSAIGDALAAFVAKLEAEQPQLYSRDLWDDPLDTVAAAIESHRRGIRLAREATANDRREQLDVAVRDAYANDDDSWAWVRDFDEERGLVWFERGGSDAGTFEQSFTVAEDDATVTLTGDPEEVAVRTEYVPVNPAGRSTTEESEEDTMPEIAESELRTLREAAGRVQTLESELSTERQARESAETERDQLKESAAVTRRTDRAREIITARATEAGVEFNPREIKGFLADIKVTESGDLDEPALTKLVDDEAAAVKESQGAGRPRSLGRTTPPTPDAVSEADLDALDDAVFGKIQEA